MCIEKRTYTEHNPALIPLVSIILRVHIVVLRTEVHKRNTLMLLKLRLYLVRDRLYPRIQWQIEVTAECPCKHLRLDQFFVQIPYEAIPDPVCVRLELDTDRDECGRSLCLCFQRFWRTICVQGSSRQCPASNISLKKRVNKITETAKDWTFRAEYRLRTHKYSCLVLAIGRAVMNLACGIMPK